MTAMWQKAGRAARAGAASGGMSRRRRCRVGLRGWDPTKEIGGLLVFGLCGTTESVSAANPPVLDAGVDMIGVMLSSPYTAERDVAGIASSPLAGT